MFKPKNLYPLALVATSFLFSCQKDTVENQPPLVNAGSPQLITLDKDSVTLTGSASDADGKVVAYLWSQVSGPTNATIINPGSASTIASTFSNGTYIFQLMATDEKGATGVDTVSVVLNRPTIKTLDLQPSNNPLEFVLANHNGNLAQGSGQPDIPVYAWTKDGLPYTLRDLLKFDLSSIPAGATIQSASLYLYSYPPPTLNGNFTDANFGTNNAMLIQQVTSNWSTATVNFNNLPSVSTSTQVVVPSTTSSMLDLNVDVKQQVQSMVSNNANYGFLFKMQTETYYCSRIFIGSYHPTVSKHPRLVIVYKK
jgi:hypothetical protein